MNQEQLWQAVLGEMEISLSKANFSTWLRHTSLLRLEGDKAIIGVPSSFIQQWVEKKYHNDIVKTLTQLTQGQILSASYILSANIKGTPSASSNITPSVTAPQAPIFTNAKPSQEVKLAEPSLNPRYTFENFVVGKHNELAHAAARVVAEQPGTKYNPFFMYGGVGLGKTHILQAIGLALRNQGKKVLYTTSESFTNQFVAAVRTNSIEDFRKIFRAPHALLIDDIQFFSGKEGTQEEFFHTYNALVETNRQLVIASDRLPRLIPALENRLISRFESGMVADVSAPDYETRMAILTAKCKEKGVQLDNALLSRIANTVRENIRELEGALNKIIAYHEFYRVPPTQDTVEKILLTLAPTRMTKTSAKKIMDTVLHHFNLSLDEIRGPQKTRKMVFPRQVAMFLLRDCLHMSYDTIGAELGRRDHTTVMYACGKIEEQLRMNDAIRGEIEVIKQKVFDLA